MLLGSGKRQDLGIDGARLTQLDIYFIFLALRQAIEDSVQKTKHGLSSIVFKILQLIL